MTSVMDASSNVAHVIVKSHMDMPSDVAKAIVLTSYLDTSSDVDMLL